MSTVPRLLRRLSADQPGAEALPLVLIVDDLAVTGLLVAAALEGLSRAVIARNGLQALDIAASQQPELILLDIRMPGMDGFTVCQALKSNPLTADIPVIFLTALNDEREEERGLEAGAIDYISKPFHRPLLRARVRNHLQLYRQQQQLQRLTQLDSLTSIANRRAFDSYLQQQWSHLLQRQQPLALLMIDIDFFKAYNDVLGHQRGDDVIRQIATTLNACMQRPSDMVARYGGEEFTCILPFTDQLGAAHIAQSIMHAIEQLGIPHPASKTTQGITVSIGGAAQIPDAGSSPRHLLELADSNLYHVKRSGRAQAFCG